MSVRDRYQRPEKGLRAEAARRQSAQHELQDYTFVRTINNCCESPDRHTPGTFAHELLTAFVADAENRQ